MAQASDLSDLLLAAADELRRAKGPSVAKASLRDTWRERAHCKWKAKVDQLEALGISHNELARRIECDPTTIHGWYHDGNKRREQLPMWLAEATDDVLASVCLTLRSGTDG